jgi:hypothetical protein
MECCCRCTCSHYSCAWEQASLRLCFCRQVPLSVLVGFAPFVGCLLRVSVVNKFVWVDVVNEIVCSDIVDYVCVSDINSLAYQLIDVLAFQISIS